MARKMIQRKKLYVIGSSIAATVLMAGYISYSLVSWSGLTSRIDGYAKSSGSIKMILSEKTSTVDRARQLDELASIKDPNCSVSPLVNWQKSLMSGKKQQIETCEQQKTQLVRARSVAARLVAIRSDMKKLAKTVEGMKIAQQGVGKADFVGLSDKATMTRKLADRLSVSKDSQEAKKELIARLDTLQKAWTKFLTANKDQKRSDYEAAVNEVDQAYQEIDEVPKKVQAAYGNLLRQLK